MSSRALPAPAKHLFRCLFEQASLGIAVEDLEGKLLLANPALCSMLGYTEMELCRMNCSEFANPEDSQEDWALFQQLRAGTIDHYSLEKRYVRKDGALLWGRLNVSLLKDDRESPVVFAFVENITERKLAEEAYRESEARFRLVADTAPVLMWMSDVNKVCSYFNKPWLDFTGRSMDSELGGGWAEGVHPEDLQRCLDTYTHAFDRREPFSMEYRLRRHDGEYRWILEIGVPRFNPDRSFAGYIGSGVDVTERKLADEALRASEERLRLAQQAARIGTFDWNIRTGVNAWTPELEAMYGLPPGGFGGTQTTFENLVHPDDRAGVIKLVDAAMKSGQPTKGEWRVVWADGSVHWIAGRWQVLMDASGKPSKVIGVNIDITERKQAEEALKRSELNYRLFVAQSSEGIFCQELEHPIPVDLPEDEQVQRILHESYLAECNDALARMYGMSPADFVGKKLTETLDAENAVNIELTRDYIRGGYRVVDRESHEVDRQGNPKVFLNSMIGIVENGMLLRTWGIQRDVTDRRQAEQARAHAEQALRESEQRFRLATQAGKMYAYEWDVASDKVVRSEEYVNVLGFDDQPKQLTRQQLLARVHADDRELFASSVDKLSPENPTIQISYRLSRPDGSVVWLEKSARAFFDEQDRMLSVTGIVADITERKRVEEALRESEARERARAKELETILDAVPVPVRIALDAACRRMTGNRAAYELARLPVGGNTSSSAPPGEGPRYRLMENGAWVAADKLPMQQAAATGKPVYGRALTVVYEDGTKRETVENAVPLLDEAGKPRGAVGTSIDLTELKQAESALKKSEEKFSKAFQQGPMALTLTSAKDHRYIDVNEAFEQLTGWRRDEVIGRTPFDIGIWVDSAQRLEFAKRVLAEGAIRGWEVHYRSKDGTHGVGFGAAELIHIGNELCILSVIADITERKRVEEALKKSEEKFSKAFQQGPMALTLTSARDHRYIDVNETFERITGWRRDEVIGRTPFDIGLWVDPGESVDIATRILTERSLRNLEHRFRVRDGSVRVGLSSAELIELDGEPCILGVTADVTDYKRSQEALHESEDKLRLLLDSTAEAIYGIDLEHRCTFCNPACLRALGYERVDEVLGKNMHNLIHHTRADGTPFLVDECRVHRVTRTGEGTHAEDEVLWRANGTSFPAEYWSYPQRRGHEVVGAVVAFNDISDRKLAEAALANVSRKLIEAQEQERSRIGRELHDDIGQRLALLAVELQQLRDKSVTLPQVRRRVSKLQKRTSGIAADVQFLSHDLHSAKLQYLGITAAVRGFCREFAEQQKVEVDFKSHDLPMPLSADVSLCLFRVLQEALHNSVKHSGVRHFEVRLWGTSDEIHLTVRDSGAGFDLEAARTSRGLGLISMEERLKALNGTLSVESLLKRGTTIHARVPLRSAGDSMRAAG